MTRHVDGAAFGEKAGAPEAEIEVTPEMIEAGSCELAHYSPREDDPHTAVVMIYRAMERARLGLGDVGDRPLVRNGEWIASLKEFNRQILGR